MNFDATDIDFSIFDGINLITEDSLEQPNQDQSSANQQSSKNVGNVKDDIPSTAAQPSASTTSLEDLAMTHFGQIMCL